VRKPVVLRVCIVKLVAAYRRRNKGPRRVASTKNCQLEQLEDTRTRETYLAALEKNAVS